MSKKKQTETERVVRVLSLGAGVQSTCVALMMVKGELRKADAVVFADTGWEPASVMGHLWRLSEMLVEAGMPVYIARAGDLRSDVMGQKGRVASLPYFLKTAGQEKEGTIRRQCTKEYKIEPVVKCVKREVLGLGKGERMPRGVVVETWYGISADEATRMRDSRVKWGRNVYPLCDFPVGSGKLMTRASCLLWLAAYYPEVKPEKSACVGCPFHSNQEWLAIRSRPEEWASAVEFDRAIRVQKRLRGEAYLHRSLKPLDEVDLDGDTTQQDFWGNECEGMCGV